ncbi:MAG: ABC transporter permease [Candidatus Magnetoovum sp. WYHC-5]|nr:ABC transporter permease [Candidatus Magnetoovum sp. WYHC-5]
MFKYLPVITISIIILLTTLAPIIIQHDPLAVDLDSIKEPPSLKHPFGTDSKGRDILSRILYGGRISLAVALFAGVVSLSIGFTVGLIAGYYAGWVDALLMALVDFLLSFPSLLLAIGISIVLPAGVFTVIFAISAVGWLSFARLIRGHVLSIREMAYVESAKALGCSDLRILLKHVLPQCIPIGIVLFGLKLGGFILTEAALSFLGLGTPPPTPSWGAMISENRAYILSEPWMVIFPGILIAITALSFNLLGDFLQKKLTPR